jgi:hypothetical protein
MKGMLFKIHPFWEFAVIFNGECCTFLRVYILYSHVTSLKKAKRCCWLISIISSAVYSLLQNGKAHRIQLSHYISSFHVYVEQGRTDRKTLVNSIFQVEALASIAEVQKIVHALYEIPASRWK